MAHFWAWRDQQWTVEPLERDCESLDTRYPPDRSHRYGERSPDREAVALMRIEGTNTEVWILMSGPDADVRINGRWVAGGIRVLCDRDEIVVRGTRRYFSTETLARIEPFDAERTVSCPRCRQTIDPEAPAVRCPRCKVWHHQSDELPCWTYADTCAMCPQPTDLAAGYLWTPAMDDL